MKDYKKIVSTILFLFITCTNQQIFAKQSVLDSIPSSHKLVSNFLEAVNSGDREIMSDFIVENYDPKVLKRAPLPMVVSLNMEFYYQTGGLGYKLKKLHPYNQKSVSADLLNTLTGSYVNMQIPITDTLAFKINWLVKVNQTEANIKYGDTQKINEEEMLNKIKFGLNKMIEDDEFSGAVLIAKNGIPIFKEVAGDASKSYLIKNKIDTKFNIASVGKIFTGLAILQLEEQGKLSFDDTVDKYVGTDWLKPEVASKIQIKHLLTHTSGLDDYFKKAYAQNAVPAFRNLNDYKTLLSEDDLLFEPGAKFSYSNSGMLILGVIIEKVSQESYFDYLDTHIFKPAGMVNSGGFYKDRPVENRATGYTKIYENNSVTFDNNQFTRILRGSPSGGAYSSVEDLLKFDAALRSNKLLSPDGAKFLFEGRPELNAGFHSFAFFVENVDGDTIALHKGDGRGVNAQYCMYLDKGYTFIVLSNYNRPAAQTISEIIRALIDRLE